jgi:hypothetical protein
MTGGIAVLLLGAFGAPVLAQDAPLVHSQPCLSVLQERKLPIRLKTRGPVPTARWEQVDEVLTGLDRDPKARDCEFGFDELFETDRSELYVPLTNNVVRTVPESSLAGLPVFNASEKRLGEYVSRVRYTRTGGLVGTDSYTLFYFQYQDGEGEIHTSGSQLLLDNYRVRWSEIAGRVGFKVQNP